MPYTTNLDILKYFNGLEYVDSKGNETNLAAASVDQFIDEQTSIIDLIIKSKYLLPITDSDDLAYLKLVTDKLVVCQIDKILRTNATDDESEFVRKRNYCKEAKEMLKSIMDGDITLTALQTASLNSYNKTTVYDDDCDCRIEEIDCDE